MLHAKDRHMLNAALHIYPDPLWEATFKALAKATNKHASLCVTVKLRLT